MAPPSKFAHVVYQTHRFDEMVDWYAHVFEATVRHRDERLAFLTYDEEHHRMAFVNLGPPPGGVAPRKPDGVGVHHVAYTWPSLGDLVALYRRLESFGVLPHRPVRHGMTLSLYYRDPDANMMEFQVDLMETDAAYDFMKSAAFGKNPVGEPFDPAELAARFEAGRPVDDLVWRSDQPEHPGGGSGGGAAAGVP